MNTEHLQPERRQRADRHERGSRSPAWSALRPASTLGLIVLLALTLGVARLWLDPPSPQRNWENRWWQIALHVKDGDGYVACKPIYMPVMPLLVALSGVATTEVAAGLASLRRGRQP
jgi:hypothetical protein